MRLTFFLFFVLFGNLPGFSQEIDRRNLPVNEFLSIELDFGHNLTFHVSANNYREDIILNDAARIIVKSNEAWNLYWSSQNIAEFQSENQGSRLPVDRLSIMENIVRRRIELAATDVKILEGKPTMPYGEEDTGEKIYVCHKPGTDKQKTLLVSENARRAHLKHGDYDGKCLEDKEDEEDEEYDEDFNEYNDGEYQYDKMCYDARYGKNLPCREYTFSYLLNLKGDMPAPARYRIDILYTITAQ